MHQVCRLFVFVSWIDAASEETRVERKGGEKTYSLVSCGTSSSASEGGAKVVSFDEAAPSFLFRVTYRIGSLRVKTFVTRQARVHIIVWCVFAPRGRSPAGGYG